MGQWIFEELKGAAVRRGPNDVVLFKTEQTAEGEYSGNDALVREILQNAIDARDAANPVTVRLAIHESEDAPNATKLAHYFSRLRDPLSGRQIQCNAAGVPNLQCRFLVCEDFGTSGLEGDIELFQDLPPGSKGRQDFYWFWRNIGRSGKTGDDLGRWGLGKTVYRAASQIGCMLGLTVRKSDQMRYLMGQAVLQIHRHGTKEYQPEGYWCGDVNAKELPLPISTSQELDEFCRDWKVSRVDQPGLSVVAPFVPEELKAERLLQAVAVHFFMPIVRGELVVEIVGPGLGTVRLDQSKIAEVCRKICWDGPKRTKKHVAPPIEFVHQTLQSNDVIATELLGRERLPELNEQSFALANLLPLRQKFAAGELVAIEVRIWLPTKKGGGNEGKLRAYLQRQMEASKCETYCVREGMTITKIGSRAASRGVQALVVVDAGPLAKLLGDTEGPAHEDWDTSAERPDREWKTWKGRVKFVRGIVDALVEVLNPPTTEPNFDLLSDFFSIEQVHGGQRGPKAGKDKKEPPVFKNIESPPKWFQITERAGGFTISRNHEVAVPEHAALKVAIAYDLPRGNPLRNWSPIDFRIGNEAGELRPNGKGLKATTFRGWRNVFRLTDFNDEFSLSVSGFDRHRDLYVRVDDVSDTTEADE